MDDCLFCKIAAGEVPSTRVHEVSADDLAAAASAAKRLAGLAVSGLGADGVTIMQSNGAAAWQTVFHYHVHVIPRYDGDPLVLPWTPGEAPADPAELADISRSYFSD